MLIGADHSFAFHQSVLPVQFACRAGEKMKSCPRCNSLNSLSAKFCQECGNALGAASVRPSAVPLDSMDLSRVIAQCREQLKALKEPIPAATNPAIAPLMGSLQAIPPEAQEARIALIEALGKIREPVILRSLLLMSGAGAKDVRQAVAIAAGKVRHSLSAYLLLPLLEDGSSRVRNAAIQALILIEQPHCIEAIFAACCKSQTLYRITCDTLKRMKPFQKARFARALNQISVPQSESVFVIRSTLLDHCTISESAAGSMPVDNLVNSVDRSEAAIGQSSQQIVHEQSFLGATSGGSTFSNDPKLSDTFRTMSAVNKHDAPEHPSVMNPSSPQKRELARDDIGRPIVTEPPSLQRHGFDYHQRTGSEGSQLDRAALEGDSVDPEEAGESMLARLMADSVPDIHLTHSQPHSRSSDAPPPFHSSSDSFADLSFFESVSQDLTDSSYSAHLLPAAAMQNSSGTLSRTPVSDRSASSQQAAPRTPSEPARGPGSDPSMARLNRSDVISNSLSGANLGSASSILRQAPAFSGVHSQPAGIPSNPWQNSMPAAVLTPPEMPMRQPVFPPTAPVSTPARPAGYPQSSFVPAFAAPTMTTTPAGPPSTSMPFQHPGHPAGVSGASSQEIDAVGQSSSHVTMPHSNSQSAPSSTNGAEASVNHVVTVHISDTTTTTSTTAETADPTSTAAEIARVSQEKNLQRLRDMRDRVFKILLEMQTAITGSVPRLVTRKISALLTTPANNLPAVKKALIDLGETESPHAVETINSFCQKPSKEIRLACAEALGSIRTASSAILLLKFLSDKSGTVTETAVKSLGKLGLPEVHPVLLAAGLINPSLRTIVTTAVEGSGEEHKNRWEQSLLTFLDSKDADLAAFSISLLARITEATHCELYEKTVSSEHACIRAASVDALVRTGKKRIIGAINETLVDSDPVVRRHAAAALTSICSPRSVELLAQLLEDSDLSVRRAAAMTAGKIDEPDLGPAIVRALERETDSVTVESLLEALQRNGGTESLSVLTRYVEGEAKQYRESAFKALRRLKSPESVPVFRRLLDDVSGAIRKQAIEQLASMKVNAVLPRLRDLLRTDSDENVRAACARAVGELHDHESLSLLEAALEDHPTVKFQAIIGLGKLGNAAAGPYLLALLDDVQPEIRYQAVKALGQLKLEGCEERVEPLLHDSDEMVRRGAEQALVAFGVSPRQISSRKMRRRIARIAGMLTPSHLIGAIPGRGGAVMTVAGLLIAVLGFWLISNVGSLVHGASSLPVFRVENVRLSTVADTAVVWRKEFVLDIVKASSGELSARVQGPVGARDVVIENQKGVLVLSGKTLQRLDPQKSYDVAQAQTKELSEKPLAVSFHPKDNLYCLFMPNGASTRLELLNAETLEQSASHDIKTRCSSRCLVSPDRKMALSLSDKGQVSIAELASGEVFTLEVSSLIKDRDIGTTLALQFSRDMKYFCVCTTTSLFVFSVNKLSLEKHLKEEGGFFAVTSTEDGSLRAVSTKGKIVELSSDLSNVTEKKIESYFDLVDIDPDAKQVILADSESRDAEIFDIQQNKVVTTIKADE